MVFTWQAPMMLLSYSLIAFVLGLSICVLTPLYDGQDYDDACKVCSLDSFVLRFSTLISALITDYLLNFSLCRLPYSRLSCQSSQVVPLCGALIGNINLLSLVISKRHLSGWCY